MGRRNNPHSSRLERLVMKFIDLNAEILEILEEMYGINCVDSIEDLKEQIDLDEIYYSGQREQTYYSWDGQKKYDRFMVIVSK